MIPQGLTDDKSILVQVMAWCRQATRHHLSQYWPRSLSKYSFTNELIDTKIWWRHLHYLWNTNMAALLHHGNDPPQELNCLTSLGRSTSHIGNKAKLSSLSIDRLLKFKISAWPKLGNKAAKNGNKSVKGTGSYFTAVKASSYGLICVNITYVYRILFIHISVSAA